MSKNKQMEAVESYFNRKIEANDFLQPFMTEVENVVQEILREKEIPNPVYEQYLSYVKTGDRASSEQPYFQKRKQLSALGLYLQWQEDEEAMNYFKNLIWDTCNEYSWALAAHLEYNEHGYAESAFSTIDLFASETAQMLAEFSVIFRDYFEPYLLKEVERNIKQRVLQPFMNKHWQWEDAENNWSAVCGGSIGITAFIIEENDTAKEAVIQRCNRAMEVFLQGYGEDGCCVEGISYWVYGFGYYVYYADLYEMLTGQYLLASEKVKAIASFPGKIQISPLGFVPFSDASPFVEIPSGLNTFLFENIGVLPVQQTKVTSFSFDYCYRWAHVSRILWWSKPIDVKRGAASVEYFSDAQWLTYKNKEIFFAAKGGDNGEPHNHNDVGNFVFGLNGDLLLTDTGAGVYTAQYFGKERYHDIHTQSEWHSVPVINGRGQQDGKEHAAKVEMVEEYEDGCTLALDITEAYPKSSGVHVYRNFHLDAAERKLILVDEVYAKDKKCVCYQSHFITYHAPDISVIGKITWKQPYEKVTMHYDSSQYEVFVEKRLIQNHQLQDEVVYQIQCRSKKVIENEHIFAMTW